MATNKPASFIIDFSTDKRSFGFYLIGSMIIILFSFLGQAPMFLFFPESPADLRVLLNYSD